MTMHLGNVPSGTTLYIPFATYDGATGASETCSGLAVTDIEIYKNGSTTQRASDNGYTLLDTDGIDFDGLTGINGFSVDLSDNTDSGFYAVGSTYWVVVSSITADSQTVNFIAATFRIVAAEATTGYPNADVGKIGGQTASASGTITFPNATLASTTNITAGTITTATNVTTVNGLAANVITAAAIATDAIDADAIKADAVTEIQSGLATAASLSTVSGYIDTEIADIQSRLPAALTAAGNMKCDALAISGDATAADNLETMLDGTGGSTLSIGQVVIASSGNDNGISVTGSGTGAGVYFQGGTSGHGFHIYGGGTAGDAMRLEANSSAGDGLHVAAAGATTAYGIHAVGGTAGIYAQAGSGSNGDGMKLASDGTGKDLKADSTDLFASGADLTAIPWNASWDAEVQSEVDDALKVALTEGYRGTGATGSVRDMLYEIIAHLGESAISSTTKTLKKIDGSTTAKTYTLDSATSPTSITETT